MERTITVTGHGTATAVPDSAVVRLAVAQRATTLADAFAGVSSGVDELLARARELTDERRIASRDLNAWPAHDNEGRQSGFEVRHSVEIRCDDLDAASTLLSAAVDAVGDRLQVDGVSLEVSDQSAATTAAREAAYADATARATHLAGLAGVRLGPVAAMVEGGPAGGRPVALRAEKADMAFAPGESSIGASLQVTWQLES